MLLFPTLLGAPARQHTLLSKDFLAVPILERRSCGPACLTLLQNTSSPAEWLEKLPGAYKYSVAAVDPVPDSGGKFLCAIATHDNDNIIIRSAMACFGKDHFTGGVDQHVGKGVFKKVFRGRLLPELHTHPVHASFGNSYPSDPIAVAVAIAMIYPTGSRRNDGLETAKAEMAIYTQLQAYWEGRGDGFVPYTMRLYGAIVCDTAPCPTPTSKPPRTGRWEPSTQAHGVPCTGNDCLAVTMVLEFCPGGELLAAVVGRPSLGFIRTIFRQLLQAVSAAHQAGVANLDIKPANVLLKRQVTHRQLDGYDQHRVQVRVGDFGIAHPSSWDVTRTPHTHAPYALIEPRGTPGFVCPELWHNAQLGLRFEVNPFLCDSFSIGVTMFLLVTGGNNHCLNQLPQRDPDAYREYPPQAKDYKACLLASPELNELDDGGGTRHIISQLLAFDMVKVRASERLGKESGKRPVAYSANNFGPRRWSVDEALAHEYFQDSPPRGPSPSNIFEDIHYAWAKASTLGA